MRKRTDKLRRRLSEADLEVGYRAMAGDAVREAEAAEWINGLRGVREAVKVHLAIPK